MIIIPDYKTHDHINMLLLIPAVPVMLYASIEYMHILLFTLSYTFGTYYLSPDLDINSKVYKRWNILRFLWCPYKDLMKHRRFSHHPILGPISLIGYLGLLLSPILYYTDSVNLLFNVSALICVVGLLFSIEFHIMVDLTYSKPG